MGADSGRGRITVHLRGVPAPPHPHADVNLLELIRADEQHRLEDLVTEGLRLEKLDRVPINLQNALATLAMRDGDRIFLDGGQREEESHSSVVHGS